MRSRITYANVAATLALVFSMSGSALAASHYLISSTKQISPKVLKKLKGANGKAGAPGTAGKEGTQGKEGPQGKEGKEGKEGAPATTLWARVAPNGTLVKGSSGVVHAEIFNPGEYQVEFNRPVTACAYEATIGSAAVSNEPGEADDNGPSFILVEPRIHNPNAVFVEIEGPEGGTEENAFHLAVFC